MAALAYAAANVADTPRDDGNGDGGGGETPDAAQGGGGGGGSGDGGGGGGDGDGGGGAKEEPKKVKAKKLSKRELRLQAKAAMMGACHILLKHKGDRGLGGRVASRIGGEPHRWQAAWRGLGRGVEWFESTSNSPAPPPLNRSLRFEQRGVGSQRTANHDHQGHVSNLGVT